MWLRLLGNVDSGCSSSVNRKFFFCCCGSRTSADAAFQGPAITNFYVCKLLLYTKICHPEKCLSCKIDFFFNHNTSIPARNWKMTWSDVRTMFLIKHLLRLTSHLQSNCSVYWIATNNAGSRVLFSWMVEELTRTMTVQQLLPLLYYYLTVSLCLYRLDTRIFQCYHHSISWQRWLLNRRCGFISWLMVNKYLRAVDGCGRISARIIARALISSASNKH